MRQVRNSVFETNSSSTHCICIVTDRKAELEYPEKVYFRCDDFGREPAELRSVEDKAAYLYSSILSLYEMKKAENAKTWIMEELMSLKRPPITDMEAAFIALMLLSIMLVRTII